MINFLNEKFIILSMVAFVAIMLFVLERFYPLRKSQRKLIPRLISNFVMAATTFIAASLLVRPLAMKALALSGEHSFGVLTLLKNFSTVQAIVGFLLLDLTFYYWHRLNHKVSFLWRFHNVHHLDPDLDVSTAFRFHFAEVAFSSVFRFIQVILIGPTLTIYLGYELVFQMATFFHHSNIRFPKAIDNLIKLVFVTPRMHGMHHSNFKSETDSNYSVVFSIWDKLHKSFTQDLPFEKVQIGVPGYSREEDNKVFNLITSPFKKQKDYWIGKIHRWE